MIEPLDLGVCRGYGWGLDAERLAVVLPGRLFGGMPSTFVAVQALLERGWGAVQVWDELLDPDVDPSGWVRERAEAALAVAGDRAGLLVAKSLSTRAACLAGERSLPAVWLTPLLDDPVSVGWLRARTAPALLVGGTADPVWDGALAREVSDDVLELPGADHAFGGPDGVRSLLANLGLVAGAIEEFAGSL
jgi:hypothetical protein